MRRIKIHFVTPRQACATGERFHNRGPDLVSLSSLGLYGLFMPRS